MMRVSAPQLAPMVDGTPGSSGSESATNDYLTTRQAAQILGVNRATVINWAKQGRFNAIQYGNRGIYRFDRTEIVDFLNRSRLQNQNETSGSNDAVS